MNRLTALEWVFNISLVSLGPVSVALLVWSAVTYKSDQSFFRFSLVASLVSVVVIGAQYLVIKYLNWHFQTAAVLERAIEDGTTVDVSEFISPFAFNIASVWWVFAIAAVLSILVPLFRVNKSAS